MSVGSGNEIAQRRAKLEELRKQGLNPFANGFTATATTADVQNRHADHDAAALEKVAGLRFCPDRKLPYGVSMTLRKLFSVTIWPITSTELRRQQ